MRLHRRALLTGTALYLVLSSIPAEARGLVGSLPWDPDGGPPLPVQRGPWLFFTPEEGAAVEAIVDRLIPPDPETPGGKDAGCAVFIDRQLAGPYGDAQGLYMSGPFINGTPQQGDQSPLTPAMRYRQGLAALDNYCRAALGGTPFAGLSEGEKDRLLAGMETGSILLDGADTKTFFHQLLTNTREGFFADPLYGGNRDMVGWKMIGFPGARYDYRDWVERHNERFPLPPVSIAAGRPQWNPHHTVKG
jgi:gluconate 2-dehydrogenase gamma chain